jgi:hypothetical protein
MEIVQLLRRRYGWIDRLLTRTETYTSLWGQYGDYIKPVLRMGGAAVLGLWTAAEGSWLPVGIAVAVVVYATLSMTARARSTAVPALPAPPGEPSPAGALPSPGSEQQAFLREVTVSLDELRARVGRLDNRSGEQAIVRAVNEMVDNHNALTARLDAVANSADAAAHAADRTKAQLSPQITSDRPPSGGPRRRLVSRWRGRQRSG